MRKNLHAWKPAALAAGLCLAATGAWVSTADAAPGTVQLAQLFGESDEDKAAREQHEQNQDAAIASLNQQVHDLENSLRSLTGQVEQLDHRISQQNDRIDRMQKDFDYRLCTMAAQQLGASTAPGEANALPCNAAGSSAPPVPPPPQSTASQDSGMAGGAPAHLAPPPGVLGTLPAGTPTPLPTTDIAADSNRPEFDSAMKLLVKAQYDQASAAFRDFADNHPKDDLAPQALYWMGDIDYLQKDYPSAARAFAEGIKKYPASPRAPDSMLKLGQSLIAMNQKKEGCTALAALPSKYPTASKSVAAQTAAARKAALCK